MVRLSTLVLAAAVLTTATCQSADSQLERVLKSLGPYLRQEPNMEVTTAAKTKQEALMDKQHIDRLHLLSVFNMLKGKQENIAYFLTSKEKKQLNKLQQSVALLNKLLTAYK